MKSLLLPSLLCLASSGSFLVAQEARVPQMASPNLGGEPFGVSISSENADVSALLYKDSGDESVWLRKSDGRGLSWDAPLRLDDDVTGASKRTYKHSLKLDGERIYVAWMDKRNGPNDDLYFTASGDAGVTWLPTNIRLDDGYAMGANDLKDFRIGSCGKDVIALCSTDNGDEGLFLTYSNDEGSTWSAAIPATSHNGLCDVDNIDMACENDVAYIVWRDNFLDGTNDTIWLSIFDLRNGVFLAQDVDVSPNMIAAGGDADDGVDVAVDGNSLAILFHADNMGGTSEQLRANLSSDLGVTFAGDKQVGEYDNVVLNHDTDNAVLLVEDGFVAVAWEDNRTGQDEIYATYADVSLGVFEPDHLCSNSTTGAGFPRLAGEFAGESLAVAWTQQDGETYSACYLTNGVWSDTFVVSDNAGFDVDYAELAWNDVYNNFLSLYLCNDVGTNEVYVGGFRQYQLDAGNPVAGTSASFGLSGFKAGQAFQVVAAMNVGSYLLADGRDIGIAVDNYTLLTKDLVQFRGMADAEGNGSTSALPIPGNLSGASLYLLGIGLDGANPDNFSDAVPVSIQ